MMRTPLAIALALLLAAAAGAQERIALVIGNGDYEIASWRLDNPVRDADLIAARLTDLDFDVDLVRDADRQAMVEAYQRFGRRLRQAG
ncbi:MAG: caspase family protein, partial [Caulobacterales bacterium]|nr:caspase family protein [Caulobacterales bacterium]